MRVKTFLLEAGDRILDLDVAVNVPDRVAYLKGDYLFIISDAWEVIHYGECPKLAARALQRRSRASPRSVRQSGV